jgi:DNA-binding NarL/FixJ family response regulator
VPTFVANPRTFVVADDFSAFLFGVRKIIEAIDGFVFVGEAVTIDDAVSLVAEMTPDLVIFDPVMPAKFSSARDAVLEMSRTSSVIVLSSIEDPDHAAHLIHAGARGFVSKRSQIEVIEWAVSEVATGERAIDPRLATRTLAALDDLDPKKTLTQVEQEILTRLAAGHEVVVIARALDMTPATVRRHIRAALSRFEVNRLSELLLIAFRNGEIAPARGHMSKFELPLERIAHAGQRLEDYLRKRRRHPYRSSIVIRW